MHLKRLEISQILDDNQEKTTPNKHRLLQWARRLRY